MFIKIFYRMLLVIIHQHTCACSSKRIKFHHFLSRVFFNYLCSCQWSSLFQSDNLSFACLETLVKLFFEIFAKRARECMWVNKLICIDILEWIRTNVLFEQIICHQHYFWCLDNNESLIHVKHVRLMSLFFSSSYSHMSLRRFRLRGYLSREKDIYFWLINWGKFSHPLVRDGWIFLTLIKLLANGFFISLFRQMLLLVTFTSV